MIRINEQYIDRFARFWKGHLLYRISSCCYLMFDEDTREYQGVHTFAGVYYDSTWIQKKCDETLNELLTRGILETTD